MFLNSSQKDHHQPRDMPTIHDSWRKQRWMQGDDIGHFFAMYSERQQLRHQLRHQRLQLQQVRGRTEDGATRTL